LNNNMVAMILNVVTNTAKSNYAFPLGLIVE